MFYEGVFCVWHWMALTWKQWLPSKELLQGTIEHESLSLTAGMEAKSLILLSPSSIPLAYEIALQLHIVLTRLQLSILQSQPLYAFILREYCNEFYHATPLFHQLWQKNRCSAVKPKILKSAHYRTLYLSQHNPLSHNINVGINQTSFISSDTWTQACNNQPSHFTHILYFIFFWPYSQSRQFQHSISLNKINDHWFIFLRTFLHS